VPGKKSRLAAAVAAAGACALLAACSPVKMGAAAIVGNDRITTTALDTQVSNLQQSGHPSQIPAAALIPAADLPKAVLGWMISFAVRNKTANDAGIQVSQTQIQTALTELQQSVEQSAGTSLTRDQALGLLGVPPDMAQQFGQWYAQEREFFTVKNGGTYPATQAAQTTANNELVTADCQSAKTLGVQVNPQYGQLAFQSANSIYAIIAGNDTLSRPAGATSPPTMPILPSC
jgi:hypothetical protein